jgi:MFS family permease
MPARLLGRILAAQSLSSLGTSISAIALSYMVFKLTGSVLQMGGVLAIGTFPLVVTSFIGGAILDRFSARNAMILADICRAGLIFAMPFLARQSIAYIYVVAGLMGVFSALFNPGQVKLVGDLVEHKDLVKANSYLSVSRDGAELLGYLAGAPLVIAVGYTLTFSLDAASYVLSALMLVGLPKAAPADRTTASSIRTLLAEAPDVVRVIWRRPQLRTNLLLCTLAFLAIMMSIPNCYGLVFEVFDRGAWGLTILEVFTASGMILGGLLVSRFQLGGDKNAYVSLGLVGMGVCFIAISFSGLFWASMVLIALAGVANVSTFVPSMVLFQQTPDTAYKGRLISIRSGFGQMGTTGGLLIGGVLGSTLGIKEAFFVAGAIGIGLSLLIYLPHRAMAARRGRAAWSEAIASGAGRRHARAVADAARYEGVGYVGRGAPVTGAAAEELTLAPAGMEEEI